MRKLPSVLMVFAVATVGAAQAPEPPLSETRLTVHTLLREDVFAGWLEHDMDRFARAERNLELLMTARPSDTANLLAWRGAAAVYRAVLANDASKPDEFARQYQRAQEAFAEAAKMATGGENDGVAAITGGTLLTFADRLPEQHRAAAWAQAYDSYSLLWTQQGANLARFPVHFRGEVLAGMTQSAQRTGRTEEAAQFLERMLAVVQDTPYEAVAKEWKANPASAATTNLACKSCHGPGRLSAKLAALNK